MQAHILSTARDDALRDDALCTHTQHIYIHKITLFLKEKRRGKGYLKNTMHGRLGALQAPSLGSILACGLCRKGEKPALTGFEEVARRCVCTTLPV